jgi:hypothetical protein
MKTRELSLATFVLAAFGASLAACGAHGTTAAPDSGGQTSSGGMGSAGTPPTSGAGSSGAQSTSAGAAAASGGAPGAAGAGTGVSFGGAPAAAGAAQAGAGAPSTTGCAAAVGTMADLLIDDLEDGNGAVEMIGSRKGYWYTFNDGTAVQVPTSSATVPFSPMAGGYPAASKFAATTSGPAFTMWGAGIGFHFSEAGSTLCAYNAAAYSGIKFWAKSTAPLKAMVQTSATTMAASLTDTSATCVAKCNDHYFLAVPVTAAWTQFTIDFAATTFKQEGWGTAVLFDKTKLIGMQFQVGMGAAFDFSIDQVTFY